MQIEVLQANLENLRPSDQTFARSLMDSVSKRATPPTDKQVHWINKLAERAQQGPQPELERQKTKVGDFKRITELFDATQSAKRPLKWPKIHIGYSEAKIARELKLSRAGNRTRVPGSINVVGGDDWFGRILDDGTFEHSPRIETPAAIVTLLKRFAKNPAKVAAEHGHLTGRCCFCNTALGGENDDSDKRSVKVGYGPVCAKHYGLPWGEASHSFKAEKTGPRKLTNSEFKAEAAA